MIKRFCGKLCNILLADIYITIEIDTQIQVPIVSNANVTTALTPEISQV